ncbi:MAG: gamma-glutamyl-gamma-aminobutyrate hydrolase family protein [Ilumatobacteraceae bacterium]
MRALLIANTNDADAGFVGHHLRRRGYAFTDCPRERPDEWPELDGHELVLLLGSEWSVYWPDVAPSVDAEIALVRAAHESGIPILGICFGNQVMARALGGTVERARTPEIGWYDVVSDVPEAIASGPWLQWHSDVVIVPGAATELARSVVGPQAWRLGRSLCTQFHPEATETMLATWTAGGGADELAAVGTTRDELMTATRANVREGRKNAEHLVDWFLDEVAPR